MSTGEQLTADEPVAVPRPVTVDLIGAASRSAHGVIDLVELEAAELAAPRVSVVIPTLNEAKNLPHVAALMPAVHQIVVVDGWSSDGTVELARELWPDVTVVLQNRRGKGNALACGFAACTGDVIVMLDADGSADPREIPTYVAALVGGAHFAKGSRFAKGGRSYDITPFRRLGNLGLNGLVNVLYRTRYTDLCYGYNAFAADCLKVIDLEPGTHTEPTWGDGFEVETLINVRIAKAGLTVAEVPSVEHPRLHGVSNLNAIRDGIRVLRTIRRERTRPTSGASVRTIVAATVPRHGATLEPTRAAS